MVAAAAAAGRGGRVRVCPSAWAMPPMGLRAGGAGAARPVLSQHRRAGHGEEKGFRVRGASGAGDGGAGAGGGAGGGGGGSGGPGGGDGGGGGGDWKRFPLAIPFVALWDGFVSRMQADPNFLFKVVAEVAMDVTLIIMVNKARRGERFWPELEFTLTQCMVSACNDASLVFLLAPTTAKAAGAAATSAVGKWLEALPSYCMQPGSYALSQRVATYFVKGSVYWCIGFVMGGIGTGIVHKLTEARVRSEPDYEPPAEMQPLVPAMFAWGAFMAVSSNTRYQIVNGLEAHVIFKFLPGALGRAVSFGTRACNNAIGGITWIEWARIVKLNQPSPYAKVKAQGADA